MVLPVNKFFTLKIRQRCAKLVGIHDEGGQIQPVGVVLKICPHLKSTINYLISCCLTINYLSRDKIHVGLSANNYIPYTRSEAIPPPLHLCPHNIMLASTILCLLGDLMSCYSQ